MAATTCRGIRCGSPFDTAHDAPMSTSLLFMPVDMPLTANFGAVLPSYALSNEDHVKLCAKFSADLATERTDEANTRYSEP